MEAEFDQPDLLAEFLERTDPRQLFALDLRRDSDQPLVYIERRAAEVLRPDARAGYLVCPIPECTSRAFTTSGGSRRDHFRHLSNPERAHASETIAHHQGKHILGRWLRHAYPNAIVHVDDATIDNRQRPDVLVETEGSRVAFEVQYAALTQGEWLRRHEGYVNEGLSDVWLFGAPSRHFSAVRYSGSMAKGSPLLRTVAAAGVPVLWINPFAELVATADPGWTRRWEETAKPRSRFETPYRVNCLSESLIEDGKFLTPALIELTARADAEEADRARWEKESLQTRLARAERERAERIRREEKRAWASARYQEIMTAKRRPPLRER